MAIEREIIEKLSNITEKNICVIGSMSEDFYKMLSKNINNNDIISIFDTASNIKKSESTINSGRYTKIKINSFPVSNKKFDWYGWHIIRYYYHLKKLGVSSQVFTAIFYRGKHLFQYDMGALPLAMDMLADGGFLAVYDCAWTLAKSPTMKPEVNPETSAQYTREQISIPHMQYLLDVYMNKSFIEQEGLSSSRTRVYRKGQTSATDRELYY